VPLKNILHVNIRVPTPEWEACRQFYCDLLGLKVGPRPPFTSTGLWLYAGELPIVHLVAREPAEPRSRAGHNALDHVSFHCTGLAEMLAKLRTHGVGYRISRVPGVNVLQVLCVDPVGVGVELSFEDEEECESGCSTSAPGALTPGTTSR
jgi:catechol 2,3-dioxygenase-like lactoylglutathione lyase family enzyme